MRPSGALDMKALIGRVGRKAVFAHRSSRVTISPGSFPHAYAAPTAPPMLVPQM